MARIDKTTIDKIMDAVDIVDVVGDFVSLKKRGANWWGLCPFHNDRSPSFSVNKAKGIFKCFSCGKAGSAVSFLMDIETMSYVEAIRWLGKKYNIEIKERETSSAERQAEAERESMYAVNDFALGHFERNMKETEDGRAIGLAYFRERGINDAMIDRFHLGYAIDDFTALHSAAVSAGFNEKYLLDTGLCSKNDSGRVYDRFRGRVIFPVHSLSGRVVAFGGRTLRKEKTTAKYVNSPESPVYSKSRELYGMYQARNAIGRKKQCILVEGYLDVISMHQAGVENVVASSGTALTEQQVGMIKRFADSVILIYDADPAGIKAALRGINMFVAAGMQIKIVLLPEGEDPDSFAQTHTGAEVEDYIQRQSQDLIGFKTDILLRNAGNDPRLRSEAINDILETVSLVPDLIERRLYIDECAAKVGINGDTLARQVDVIVARRAEEAFKSRQRAQVSESIADIVDQPDPEPPVRDSAAPQQAVQKVSKAVDMAERDLLSYIVRYGAMYLCDVADGDQFKPMTVISYVETELSIDDLTFSHPSYRQIWALALEAMKSGDWAERHAATESRLLAEREERISQGRRDIIERGLDVRGTHAAEDHIQQEADRLFNEAIDEFDSSYIRTVLLRHEDRAVSDLAVALTTDHVVLSKMHPKVDLRADLCEKLPLAIYCLKGVLLKEQLYELTARVATASDEECRELMEKILRLKETSMEFDRFNGEIVITPHRR